MITEHWSRYELIGLGEKIASHYFNISDSRVSMTLCTIFFQTANTYTFRQIICHSEKQTEVLIFFPYFET